MNEEQLTAIRDGLTRLVFAALLETLGKPSAGFELTGYQYKKDNIPEVRITLPGGDLLITIGASWQPQKEQSNDEPA